MKRINVFKENPILLTEMLGLRRVGWSMPTLAQKYRVDYSTIRYHCYKNNIGRPDSFYTERFGAMYLAGKDDLPIYGTPAKTYRDYVNEHNKRNPQEKINPPRPEIRFSDISVDVYL